MRMLPAPPKRWTKQTLVNEAELTTCFKTLKYIETCSAVVQAMVPLWDMLNHVTGMCNVRLHHNEVAGALEMIATAAVPAGGATLALSQHWFCVMMRNSLLHDNEG